MHGLIILLREVIAFAIFLLLIGTFLVVLLSATRVIMVMIVLMVTVMLSFSVSPFDGSCGSCNNAASSLNHGCVQREDVLSSSLLASSSP